MDSFLHENCKAGMCDDCVNIAEEYQELLGRRTQALQIAENERAEMEKKLAEITRRASAVTCCGADAHGGDDAW